MCDAFVSVTSLETFGIASVEAMAMELPVVSYASSGEPALSACVLHRRQRATRPQAHWAAASGQSHSLYHGVNGLVVADPAAEDFAAAVLEVLSSPSDALRMGAAGADLVRRHFDINVMVTRYAQLYSCLLQCTAGEHPAALVLQPTSTDAVRVRECSTRCASEAEARAAESTPPQSASTSNGGVEQDAARRLGTDPRGRHMHHQSSPGSDEPAPATTQPVAARQPTIGVLLWPVDGGDTLPHVIERVKAALLWLAAVDLPLDGSMPVTAADSGVRVRVITADCAGLCQLWRHRGCSRPASLLTCVSPADVGIHPTVGGDVTMPQLLPTLRPCRTCSELQRGSRAADLCHEVRPVRRSGCVAYASSLAAVLVDVRITRRRVSTQP